MTEAEELRQLLEGEHGEIVVKLLQDPLVKNQPLKYKLALIKANLPYFVERMKK